jgi:F-box/leucine-rich repeat protein 14
MEKIPSEIFGHIFEFLEMADLIQFVRVCKKFYQTIWTNRKNIDVSDSRNFKAKINDSALLAILQKTKNLEVLNLSETYYVTAETLRKLGEMASQLQHLTSLKLNAAFPLMGSNTEEANQNIMHLRPLTTLQDLQLKWHKFSDDGMRAFENMVNMTNLDLTGCEMVGSGFRYLTKMTNLKRLFFSFSPTVTNEAFEHIAHLTTLEWLELQYCQHVTDEGAAKLSTLKNLVRINFHGCKINDSTVEMIANNMPKITQLHLSDCANLTNKAIESILRMPNLTGLYMYRCEAITPEAWGSLAGSIKLRELYLNRTKVDDSVLEKLAPLVDLNRLHFGMGEPNVTDRGIGHLKNFSKLTWLDCNSCQLITNAALKTIATLTNLRRLRLSKCSRINDEGVVSLLKLPNLQNLDLAESGVTKEFVKEKFTHIKSLIV